MSLFLVLGCGSIGERHIKNLLSLGQEVYCYDKVLKRMEDMVNKYQISVYDFKSQHLPIDAFIICTPPNYHIPFAKEAIEHNSHIFVEKPMSHTLDGVDEVIESARAKNLVLQVGYQFRFHPGLRLVKELLDEGRIGKLLSIRAEFGQYLPDWHPQEDYRNLYTCYEKQGGGIILDSSHEIDYVRWLANSEVKQVNCFAGKLSNLEVDVEDTAEINLEFENGVIGNIHLDMINRNYTRKCELVGELGTIAWDYRTKIVAIYPKNEFHEAGNTDPYLEEMKHFLSCIEGKEKPIVDGYTGKRVLEIALAAKQSAKEGRIIESSSYNPG